VSYCFCQPQAARADCASLEANGLAGSVYSATVRYDGNQVWSYAGSTPSQTDPNSALAIAWAEVNMYLNGSLWYSYTAESNQYGASIQANIYQHLYYNGTYNLGTYQSLYDAHWATSPYCTGLGYVMTPIVSYTQSGTYYTMRPFISTPMSAFWFLGTGQPSIDGYYVQTPINAQANYSANYAGVAPTINWVKTTNPSKISLGSSTGSQVVVTSLAPSDSSIYDVGVTANVDGLPSAEQMLAINTPAQLIGPGILITDIVSCPNGVESGWIIPITYEGKDMWDDWMTRLTTNEQFTNWNIVGTKGWGPVNPSVWRAASWTSSTTFVDSMWAYDCTNSWHPAPAPPDTPNPVLAMSATQKISMGSATTGAGQPLQTKTMEWYTSLGWVVN
jgi:hypothetical protein